MQNQCPPSEMKRSRRNFATRDINFVIIASCIVDVPVTSPLRPGDVRVRASCVSERIEGKVSKKRRVRCEREGEGEGEKRGV